MNGSNPNRIAMLCIAALAKCPLYQTRFLSTLTWATLTWAAPPNVAAFQLVSTEAERGGSTSQPDLILLWPETPPGQNAARGEEADTSGPDGRLVADRPVIRLGNVSSPSITVYPAPQEVSNGTAVLVCPGGGYHILAWDLEGTEVCHWLNSIGVTGILLKYRVPRADRESIPLEPLQDAQRALSLVRSRAAEWQIDPGRIGVLGFSAGGNLAARLSTQYRQRVYESMDAVDRLSCRPDFAMLIYPAYLFEKGSENGISRLLPVDEETPPMFLTMANDDPIGSENILRMGLALRRARVPVEVHLYQSGGHGYGLRKTGQPATYWPEPAADWLRQNGWASSPFGGK
jgi:acetyl esterase/lipase